MQSNGSDFDLLVTVTLENVGKLAQGGLIQPLNHTYLPNFEDQLWTRQMPDFYDVGRQYSVPYMVYTTGIAWRNDLVTDDIAAMDNPYDIFWDTTYAGQTHLLNGARDTLATALLRMGYDPNESDPAILDQVKQMLLDGADVDGLEVRPRGLHRARTTCGRSTARGRGRWSITSTTCPKGLDITALSYVWPPQGAGGKAGSSRHDLFAISKGAANPVLAHTMIDYPVRAGQRARRTTATRATSRPCKRRSTRRRR